MLGVVTGFDWLSDLFPTTTLKIAVSIGAVGLVVAVLLAYQRIHAWVAERARPLYADIVAMTLLISACAVSAAVVTGVWGRADEIQQLYTELDPGGNTVPRAVFSFILLVLTVIVTRFVRRVIEEVLDSTAAVTEHQRQVTHRLSQVILWSVSLVVILGIWIEDLGSLLVGAGFLGIVLGMAARQTLGTVLAGFVLMFARPFEIGDWIEIEDDEGIVTDISIVNTRVRSFDGEYIMIPNDVIASSMVTNRSKRGRLRLEVEVGVDYGTDVERAADLAEDAVADIDEVLSAPSPQVVGKSFGDSAVVLGVRFWIDKPSARRYWMARTAAIDAIKRAFEGEDIKIPFPQRELSGRAETGGVRIADERAASDEREETSREHRMTTLEENE
ncbi:MULTISPECIES: mechanosensitive ion channel family protein [Natrinema]|uniref:MscS Mechanosensitive ion channel n=1 Tax=Natrinema gari JCM 14663 TaxID=1230459 RepID=L9ZDS4_9EURY|nr:MULTISPECIES: mechanosensitive ion channel family protein [Natrinema]AFO56419.1 MscS Mechanosensitive ion channel [Natrinema sp. J7-2]ELY83328.1 MscS Mechanosensitive ion channel [Natrinema gari JCM 14663]